MVTVAGYRNRSLEGGEKREIMRNIDTILERLQDLQWHSLDEIGGYVSLSGDKIKRIIAFLEENEFINFENDKTRAKIRTTGLRFLELPAE